MTDKKPYYSIHNKVRIFNEKGVGPATRVAIGDYLIPVHRAVITIEPDDFVKVDISIKADYIDINSLEANTSIKLLDDGKENE